MSNTINNEGDTKENNKETIVKIPIGNNGDHIEGNLYFPKNSQSLVIFAHGSGSGRHSPRNQYVAHVLNNNGISTMLVDLLTEQEEEVDDITREHRFNIPLLADRLMLATDFAISKEKPDKSRNMNIGYFGASTGAAAALIAADKRADDVKAVVSRGGRVDLASRHTSLQNIKCPALFIVGEKDSPVIEWNQQVIDNQLFNVQEKKMIIIQGASHLFEEEGKLEEVAEYAADWFKRYL